MAALPAALRAALAARLEGQSRQDLTKRSIAISGGYRDRRNSSTTLLSDADALAYAVARMPATYAAMAHGLAALKRALPDLSPETLMDAGCGPGTATFAASAQYPRLRKLTLLDRNRPFLRLAQALAEETLPGCSISVTATDLTQPKAFVRSDLVTGGYVLAELPPSSQSALVAALWQATGSALVLTEPGTPDGFSRLSLARQTLLAAGAHIAAPCTHGHACPMTAGNWCRFPVRVQRSRDHLVLKAGSLPYEDEPVAYLVAVREVPLRLASHRIIGPQRATKAHIELPGCGKNGLEVLTAARRNGESYKSFKKLDWGDEVENPIQLPHAMNQDQTI